MASRMKAARKGQRKAAASNMQTSLSLKELNEELERAKMNEIATKTKIRALECEVEILKSRLESLRKAKNTTIVKRDREQPLIPLSPKLGRRSVNSVLISNSQIGFESHNSISLQEEECDRLAKRLSELEQRLMLKDQEWKERLSKREVELNKEWEKKLKEDKRLRDVKSEEGALQAEIDKLIAHNDELTARLFNFEGAYKRVVQEATEWEAKCVSLREDLSEKEAQWIQKEAQLQNEVRKQWGERYHEWMMKAEKKMEELQKVNSMLQVMLKTKAHNPDLQ